MGGCGYGGIGGGRSGGRGRSGERGSVFLSVFFCRIFLGCECGFCHVRCCYFFGALNGGVVRLGRGESEENGEEAESCGRDWRGGKVRGAGV